jgi:hypothetical protein
MSDKYWMPKLIPRTSLVKYSGLIRVQSLKLAVSLHSGINVSVTGNMIATCRGNMSTASHRGAYL